MTLSVARGADPRRIAFDVRVEESIGRDEHGGLVLRVGEDEIRCHKPVVYQCGFGGTPAILRPPTKWVPLDKSEGIVKGALLLSGANRTAALPEKVEDQGPGISR